MDLIAKHNEAMSFSFKAKQARLAGEEDHALDLYQKAAKLESELADYYLDKASLEPTRSIIVRSAAFLNLKAGNVEASEKYIFWGLVNSEDKKVKDQLYEALELCVLLKNLDAGIVSGNVDYIYKLRQNSVFYSLDPKNKFYSSAVTLNIIADFANHYTRSIKAFARTEYLRSISNAKSHTEFNEDLADEFQKIVNPVVTSAVGLGGFQFAVATDILPRLGETTAITSLKAGILNKYHNNVFIRDFDDETIREFRRTYSKDELDDIFRPLIHLRSSKAEYRIQYYDKESLKKEVVGRVSSKEKRSLLPIKTINKEDIGFLEAILTHTRETNQGSYRKVIFKQDFTAYTFDYPTAYINSTNHDPIILKEPIIVSVNFNNQDGFILGLDELPVSARATTFEDALQLFFNNLADYIHTILKKSQLEDDEFQYVFYLNKLIENPGDISDS